MSTCLQRYYNHSCCRPTAPPQSIHAYPPPWFQIIFNVVHVVKGGYLQDQLASVPMLILTTVVLVAAISLLGTWLVAAASLTQSAFYGFNLMELKQFPFADNPAHHADSDSPYDIYGQATDSFSTSWETLRCLLRQSFTGPAPFQRTPLTEEDIAAANTLCCSRRNRGSASADDVVLAGRRFPQADNYSCCCSATPWPGCRNRNYHTLRQLWHIAMVVLIHLGLEVGPYVAFFGSVIASGGDITRALTVAMCTMIGFGLLTTGIYALALIWRFGSAYVAACQAVRRDKDGGAVAPAAVAAAGSGVEEPEDGIAAISLHRSEVKDTTVRRRRRPGIDYFNDALANSPDEIRMVEVREIAAIVQP